MKIIDKICFIEFADFLAAGWSEDAIKKANYRNGPFWQMIPDPSDRRKTLVSFDDLRPKDKERLTVKFGNPYEYLAKEPIKKMLELDFKAEQFYREYRYNGTQELPSTHQVKYTTAASWLNLLIRLQENPKQIKKDLNLTIDKFWQSTCEIFKAADIELPKSYGKLLLAIKEYKNNGYASLVDWRFGNTNSAKIGKTETGFDEQLYNTQIAFIRKAASMHNNFDAQQITDAVNFIFKKQGWPVISHATVYNVVKENSHLTLPGRRGAKEYNSRLAMQHLRKRPDFPLYYFTLDGWTVELLYQENNTYNNRLCMVVVLDPFNNYPIGYAIGDRENTALIRQANRNASIHINELFGGYYQPRQLQSDNYGIKQLTPFYTAMSHLHTPAAVGNAKAKVIEPYFNYLNKTYCQKLPNWSGFNVTSKKGNQPNTEYLNAIKTTFPDKATLTTHIEMIISEERKKKIADYKKGWELMPAADRKLMSSMDMLMVHGRPTNYTNSITGMGLTVTINKEKLIYDTFDPAFRSLQHLKWKVLYDEYDLTSILAISEDDKHKFVLDQKRALPMDVHSMTADDHNYRSLINDFNRNKREEILTTYETDDKLVAAVMDNTPLALNDFNEATLKLMFTNKGQQKEMLQTAKGLKQETKKLSRSAAKKAATQDEDLINQFQQFIETNNDFSQFQD